jgi:hypothetical protein
MVVVEGGGNHGQSLESPANNCVQGYVNGYLDSGGLPGKAGLVNATCSPTADPAPLSLEARLCGPAGRMRLVWQYVAR